MTELNVLLSSHFHSTFSDFVGSGNKMSSYVTQSQNFKGERKKEIKRTRGRRKVKKRIHSNTCASLIAQLVKNPSAKQETQV